MSHPPGDVTRLLREWQAGREAALEQLTPIVYQELRRIAFAYMRRERPDHTCNRPRPPRDLTTRS